MKVLRDAKKETASPVGDIIGKNIVQTTLMVASEPLKASTTVAWDTTDNPRDIRFARHHNAFVEDAKTL